MPSWENNEAEVAFVRLYHRHDVDWLTGWSWNWFRVVDRWVNYLCRGYEFFTGTPRVFVIDLIDRMVASASWFRSCFILMLGSTDTKCTWERTCNSSEKILGRFSKIAFVSNLRNFHEELCELFLSPRCVNLLLVRFEYLSSILSTKC